MTFASFELDRGRCSRGKQTPRPGDCAAHAAARVPRVRMSRKTLKRIATNTVPSKKYVLGDVLGEGPLPRLPRRRASCLRRRGMAQEPTRTQRSPLPARLLAAACSSGRVSVWRTHRPLPAVLQGLLGRCGRACGWTTATSLGCGLL